MNSSGIKRGLAAAAVGALAVTGLPFLASSASAAPGDSIAVGTVGPVRNANAAGGTIVLKTKGVDPANLQLVNTALNGSPNSPSQTVEIVGTPTRIANGAAGDSNPTDGLDEITVQVAVTTPAAGDTANFAVFEDEDLDPAAGDQSNDVVDASEARAQVSVVTAGAPASVEVTPESQTTATGVASPNYTVTVKDSAGRTTQLQGAETFTVTSPQDAVATGALNATTLGDGTATFTATAPTAGTKALNVSGATGVAATVTDSASLTVIAQATIAPNEFDITTGADTYAKGDAFGGTVEVRVDQSSVTFDIQSVDGVDADSTPDDANTVVIFQVSAPGGSPLRFGGQTSATYTVVLDAAGKGTLTITPTGIVEGASFDFVSPSGPNGTVEFTRAAADSVAPTSSVYVTKVGSATNVTVEVKDQFGNPIGAPAQVSITRGVRNGGTTTARQTVDATGKATFSLPDAGTAPGTESFTINLYEDQFDATPQTGITGGTINYTADGLGADFTVAGVTTTASQTVIRPLTDANVNGAPATQESAVITVAAGTANAPVTVTVDNGALVLKGTETNLTQGAASDTITLNGAGTNVGVASEAIRIVGTKTGVVNVTVASGGRTETYALTVTQDPATVVASARNVELTGPESANAGGTATFTATVTDAFGNPVAGVPLSQLPITLSGPANLQSSDTATDAAGKLVYNVILTDNANSPVTARVTGTGSQFGAAANSTTGTANDAQGLSASEATDSVTVDEVVNIRELEEAVEEAQAKVDNAQDLLDAANDNLAVAKAEKKVAQKAVKAAKKDLKQAKKKKKGVKAAQAALRNAKGDLTVANAKANAAKNRVASAEQRLADAQAELEAAEQALEDAQSDEG